MKLGELMYKQQQPQQGEAGAEQQAQAENNADGEKVVDAEFEDKK